MVIYTRRAALVAATAAFSRIAISCRRHMAPPAVDPAMASCVAPSTMLLAGIHLERLRAATLYSRLPPAARALLDPLSAATYLLLASDGNGLLSIARGPFREPPAGATLAAPGLAVAGPPDSIRAALAQHRSGHTGVPDLLAHADAVARGNPIWIVADGGANLPFTGNAANLNRLLHITEYATLGAQLDSRIELDGTAVCRTAGRARQFEETLRALVSLAAAGNAREPDLAALLDSIQVRREDHTVRATLAAAPAASEKLLRLLPR